MTRGGFVKAGSKTWNGMDLVAALELRSAPVPVIEARQLELLRNHLGHAARVPFYRDLFERTGCRFDCNRGLYGLLETIPLTSREDLDASPDTFGLTDFKPVHDIALTSGTTGNSVVVPYTESDLQRLAYNEAIAYYSAGVREQSTVLLTVTLDRCFIAGLAYYSGVSFLGATAIRSGPGQLAKQWELIERFGPDAIVGVPTFLHELGRWGLANGIDVRASSIKTIITIGEPARKEDCSLTPVGQALMEMWNGSIHSSYGATELEAAFGECSAGRGGHVHPEMMIAEIVDDEGKVLPDGELGEVVVTPLGVEGFPLVRFRTGDIARLYSEPCCCGWNTKRLGPIEGRLAQRLKYKGTTIYPEAIFHVIQGIEKISGAYVEVRSEYDGADEVLVVVGCDSPQLDKGFVQEKLQARLRVVPDVVIKPVKEVAATMAGEGGRKPKKFFDYRKSL